MPIDTKNGNHEENTMISAKIIKKSWVSPSAAACAKYRSETSVILVERKITAS